MTEKNKKDIKDLHSQVPKESALDELDAAGKSLSEALRLSFIILKVIMIVLVIAFLASGFETVGSDEQAIVLRFGKIIGEGEKRLLKPGPHWILPYPIDEIVKIPVEKTVNLPIDSFWYRESANERLSGQTRIRPTDPLDPLVDGYCLTRSEQQNSPALVNGVLGEDSNQSQADSSSPQQSNLGGDGSDYNIVHTRWQLTYQISNPERFFQNIQIRDIKSGEIYFNVIEKELASLLTSMFEDAVTTAIVNYTIDEAIASSDRIPMHVETQLQDKLDSIESGIKVISVQLTSSDSSPQVKAAFEASTLASQLSAKTITDAHSYADSTIYGAAGPVAKDLFAALHDESVSEEKREYLWSQLAGTAREKQSEARIYAANVEKDAEANANYLKSLLPEYKQRPKLVVQRLYLDAIENILNNADEKFIVQSTQGTKGKEIRVQLNRDPLLKSQKIREQTSGQEE